MTTHLTNLENIAGKLLTTAPRPSEIVAGKWWGSYLSGRWMLLWLLVHWSLAATVRTARQAVTWTLVILIIGANAVPWVALVSCSGTITSSFRRAHHSGG